MGDFKKKAKIKSEKLCGGIKETAGKITGNEEMEFKGKMKKRKAAKKDDVRKKLDDIKNIPKEAKEQVYGKLNDIADGKKRK